jgi:NAD(P)-dependent dehydrogenase (short-subunit alcohol dehydrogenase family)
MAPPRLRTALVTGAAQRIGRTLALTLARDGWSVAVHYAHSRLQAEQVVGEIAAGGGRAAAVGADLSRPESVAALVAGSAAALGAPVSCLVNNAAIFEEDSALDMTPASLERHLAINLKAPLLLAQALARLLPDGLDGNVVNIVDQRVLRLSPEFFSYTLAKSTLWTATRTLAQALAPRVRVNAIGPGPVLQSIHQSQADFAAEAAATPLGRATSADEIAAALRFILAAPALTGQMIVLDSGQHIEWRSQLPSAGGGGRGA